MSYVLSYLLDLHVKQWLLFSHIKKGLLLKLRINFFMMCFCLAGRRHTLDLAASALAGLASTEDFTKVRLRKTAGPEENLKDEYRGTKPIMLIHIKGKSNTLFCTFRKAQLRVS